MPRSLSRYSDSFSIISIELHYKPIFSLCWKRLNLRGYTPPERKNLKTIVARRPEDTMALGEAIGKAAPGGAVIAFKGELGAGKTTLSKGIARGLGIDEEVTSPTYTIISEYSGRLRLIHMDAYRLGGEADFRELGGRELLGEAGSLCLVEWSEKLPGVFDSDAAVIDIRVEADGSRRLCLSGAWLEELFP